MKKQEELLREKNSWDDKHKIKTETMKFLTKRKFLYSETKSQRFF